MSNNEKDAYGNYKQVLIRGYCQHNCGYTGQFNAQHICSMSNKQPRLTLSSPPDNLVIKGGKILAEKLDANGKQMAVFTRSSDTIVDILSTANEVGIQVVKKDAPWIVKRGRWGSLDKLPKLGGFQTKARAELEGDKKFNKSFRLGQYQYKSIGVASPPSRIG